MSTPAPGAAQSPALEESAPQPPAGPGRRVPAAACPLQPGQPCTLCHPEARIGPQDCPTVAIVMDDEDLRAELARRRARWSAEAGRSAR